MLATACSSPRRAQNYLSAQPAKVKANFDKYTGPSGQGFAALCMKLVNKVRRISSRRCLSANAPLHGTCCARCHARALTRNHRPLPQCIFPSPSLNHPWMLSARARSQFEWASNKHGRVLCRVVRYLAPPPFPPNRSGRGALWPHPVVQRVCLSVRPALWAAVSLRRLLLHHRQPWAVQPGPGHSAVAHQDQGCRRARQRVGEGGSQHSAREAGSVA